jgi:hypothetical protein
MATRHSGLECSALHETNLQHAGMSIDSGQSGYSWTMRWCYMLWFWSVAAHAHLDGTVVHPMDVVALYIYSGKMACSVLALM